METRIGLLGGSFDPIHYGHLAIAEEARLALQLDRVIFIPAAQQPFKLGQHAAPAAARLAMTQLACADNPAFAVSTIELDRGGPSYMAVTLEQLRRDYAGELYLILGADSLGDLPRWHAAPRIVELARLVGVGRPGVGLDLAQIERALPGLRGRLTLLAGPQLMISSTLLRQRAAAGQTLRYLMPDAVVEFIREQRPYLPA